MKSSDELFQLIKSLNKHEKRYFILYASRNILKGSNNYIKLFTALNNQKEYNEEAIRKSFSKERFIKNLAVTKHYLYNLILKSLHIYHANISEDSVIKEQLHYAEILHRKKLFSQCGKVLSKARNLAIKSENYLRLIEIHEFEGVQMKATSYFGKTQEDLDVLFNEENKIFEKYKNIRSYQNLFSKFNLQTFSLGIIRGSKELKKLNTIINNPLLKSDDKAISNRAKSLFYNIHFIYSNIKGDLNRSYDSTLDLLFLFESNPEYLRENFSNYLASLYNHLLACLETKKYDEVHHHLEKLKSLPQNPTFKKKSYDPNIRVYSHLVELTLYVSTGQFQKGISLINPIEKIIRESKGKLRQGFVLTFYFQITNIYIGLGEYRKALTTINKIINNKDNETNDREDILSFAWILNLVIHFELENENLLEYIIKSTYRFLYKRKRLYQFETLILNFLKKNTTKFNSHKELIKVFGDFKLQLQKLSGDPFEKRAVEYYFDFISWLESKIEKRDFADIVKEKAQIFMNK